MQRRDARAAFAAAFPIGAAALLFALLLLPPAEAQVLSGPPGAVPSGGTNWLPLSQIAGETILADSFANQANPVQAALNAAAAAGGGTVYLKGGSAYTLTASLVIASNTRLLCGKGATLTFNGTGWTGADEFGLANLNHDASVLTDHDIAIEGCNFVAAGSFVMDGVFHHIDLRMTQHVRITRNVFTGGGDGTAILASTDWLVAHNSMSGAQNACWDSWDATSGTFSNFSISDNPYCSTATYGVLVTGTNTGSLAAGVATQGTVAGNTITVTGQNGLAIWIGDSDGDPAGSGAAGILVAHNLMSGDGTHGYNCVRVSGATTNILVEGNDCANSPAGANAEGQAFASEPGGSAGNPVNTVFEGNSVHGVATSAGQLAPIVLNGAGDVAIANHVSGGGYPYAIYSQANGASQIIAGNHLDPGTSGRIVAPSAAIVDPGACPAGFAFGNNGCVLTLTASNSATLQWTGLAGYDRYRLACHNVIPATSAAQLEAQFGEGGTPTWETAGYYGNSIDANHNSTAVANVETGNGAAILLAGTGERNVGANNLSGEWLLLGFTGNSMKHLLGAASYQDASSNIATSRASGVYTGDSNPITALRLQMTSGNITSGTCSLYAVAD